jgi:DnaJ family protein B protein 4
LKYHPDRNKDKLAKCKFQEIGAAFEVLNDKRKRREYDNDSEANEKRTAFGFGGEGLHTTTNAEDLFAHFFSDIPPPPYYSSDEDDFFGLGLNCNNSRSYQPPSPPYSYHTQKPQSVKRTLPVSLEDLYTGITKRLKVTRTLSNKTTDKVLTVNVKPGLEHGAIIHFAGEGNSLPSGETQDIDFEIQQKPHSVFTRRGDNLHVTIKITLLEALTGFKKSIQRLDNTTSCIIENKARIIQSGQEEIIIGEGMPNLKTGEKGDMIVHFEVEFPQSLTKEQCQALEHILP